MGGHGTISETELMKKLVSARKIMNKVDDGSYQTGHVDREVLGKSTEELMESTNLPNNPGRSIGNVDVSRINKTKLPDNIKKAMIESPIPQISLNDTLDMDFVKGAKRLMEQEGLSTGNNKSQKTQQKPSSFTNGYGSDLVATLTPIIENIIRKTLDEIVDKKLMQILTAQHTVSINENLAIKVGDSIFTGKITRVNKSK
jgi:hypothetical protein